MCQNPSFSVTSTLDTGLFLANDNSLFIVEKQTCFFEGYRIIHLVSVAQSKADLELLRSPPHISYE